MPYDAAGLLLLVVTSAITFGTSRYLSRRWREKRRRKAEAARLAGESRQVRRARQRRAK
jgi:hypothetical protein